ncbi:reverse transcriptase-like protein, partial [Bacteroides uniformis]|uniref:reverse transcriptase-like protein n=1 Tax=Bacteroides uniformis TaxID=820 RepID=UPI0034DB1044
MGDSQSIIKTIADCSSPFDLRLSRLINGIRTLMKSFQSLNFFHVKRDNNKDADVEANKVVHLPLGVILRDGVEG